MQIDCGYFHYKKISVIKKHSRIMIILSSTGCGTTKDEKPGEIYSNFKLLELDQIPLNRMLSGMLSKLTSLNIVFDL